MPIRPFAPLRMLERLQRREQRLGGQRRVQRDDGVDEVRALGVDRRASPLTINDLTWPFMTLSATAVISITSGCALLEGKRLRKSAAAATMIST